VGTASASDRVVAAGRACGVLVDVREFPAGTKTAADAAKAIGCPVSAIVKSLVFTVDGSPVVVLVPGDRRLDPVKLRRVAGGGRVERAALDLVRDATGFVAGGTPPFGYPRPLPIWADQALRRNDPVWAAGGTPTTVFRIATADLIRASGAVWADLS